MNSSERLRATYGFKPVDHLFRKEFESESGRAFIPSVEQEWQAQGMPADRDAWSLFGFDPPAEHYVQSGSVPRSEAPLLPSYERRVIEDLGQYQIIRDEMGRLQKTFKTREYYMPQFLRTAVASRGDWEEDVKPRLDPRTPERWSKFEEDIAEARRAAQQGLLLIERVVGGYMYLRALLGSEGLLYAFHDTPDLVHDMMRQWATLVDAVLEKIQARVELDTIKGGDDICYKSGLLISPRMFREFLLPYYQEVYSKARQRQTKRLFVLIDSDGYLPPAIPLYREAGVDIIRPFEVAAGCDVVEIGEEYPDLVIEGGIDKRVLAAGKEAIDAYLHSVLPPMLARGGYIPTCDHHVPLNVSYENYLYYRRRICELDHFV